MGGTQEGAPGLDCGDAEKKPAAQGQSHARATSAPVFKASANRMKGGERPHETGNGGGFNCGLKLKRLPLINSNRRACAAGLRPAGAQV